MLSDMGNGGLSAPTSASEPTLQVNHLHSPIPFALPLSDTAAGVRSRSSISLNMFHLTDDPQDAHSLGNAKATSLSSGSSFEALMHSLKSMRERDLDGIVYTGDDKLISVAD